MAEALAQASTTTQRSASPGRGYGGRSGYNQSSGFEGRGGYNQNAAGFEGRGGTSNLTYTLSYHLLTPYRL